MGTTTNYALRYPEQTDLVDVAQDVKELATDADAAIKNHVHTAPDPFVVNNLTVNTKATINTLQVNGATTTAAITASGLVTAAGFSAPGGGLSVGGNVAGASLNISGTCNTGDVNCNSIYCPNGQCVFLTGYYGPSPFTFRVTNGYLGFFGHDWAGQYPGSSIQNAINSISGAQAWDTQAGNVVTALNQLLACLRSYGLAS